MKLTAAEKAKIVSARNKTLTKISAVREARRQVNDFVKDLDDEQMLELSKQLRTEEKRVYAIPGDCTCDQQWTNPRCPRRLAGWGGFDCNIPPSQEFRLTVKL